MGRPFKTHKVLVYRISYFEGTKRLYDIMVLRTAELPYSGRDYYESMKKAGIKVPPLGICGTGWATVGGGSKEFDLTRFREI